MDVNNQLLAAAAVSVVLVAMQQVHNSSIFKQIYNNNQPAGSSKQCTSGIGNNALSNVSNCSSDLKWQYGQGQQKQHHGAQERAPGVAVVCCDSAGYRQK